MLVKKDGTPLAEVAAEILSQAEKKEAPEWLLSLAREQLFRERIVPNLFPDMTRESYEGSEDFIFGAPIQEDDWRVLYQNSMKSKNGVRFYTDRPNKITILLREQHHTDDDVLEAGAWLRMLLGDKNRMYAVESFREMSLTDRMLKTIGAPRHLSVMYDLPSKLGDDEK